MATSYLTAGPDLSIGAMGSNSDDRPKLQSCVSIVVDDVDGDEINFSCNDTPYPQQAGMIQAEGDDVFDDNVDARSDISHSSRGSRGSTSREENETRLQQIKDEVQNRRDEFARLLDEHEQVVRELRRIESSSEIQISDQNGHNPAESSEASPTSDSSDQQATSQQEE